ncbi:MAG: hypothetical protein AVDCRST_MAG72-1370 [uncultured Nocardioidaceae bacterium]|uniref:DUF4097 domain-containing protein n=1 Tax=uncultured Nocardioidaceae bacterium TaxID=253824 RepID=A0A6J4M4L4_9ACTN|nr:MAG: hypothetical protein AVDCRST_MAG72-1370 [uncultured Nocardioidaceae bacterium]
MERTFNTAEPISLHVEIHSGDLHVDAREDIGETRISVDGRRAEEATVEQRGNQIVVFAPPARSGFFSTGGGSELTVTASVPRDTELSTKLGSADLVAAGRLGSARLRSGSGDLRVDELGSDAVLETGSGDISVEAACADVRIKSGSGDVDIRRLVAGGSISTGSGDVVLGTSGSPALVKSGSGSVRVEEAHSDLTLSTASGDVSVHQIRRGALRVKAVSGDVSVGVPSGIPVWTDISCVSGRVSSDLDGAGEPGEGQDFVEIRATTVSGDIALEQR